MTDIFIVFLHLIREQEILFFRFYFVSMQINLRFYQQSG